ncbi:MAG: hypothetical protein IJ054_04945, partial [Lachnospiraceae bacterium]|nr:hypothetical protein [Lachnospiraceae bacterium]
LSYLDDFAATLCEKYIKGDRTYEETMASLDAINEIDSSKQIAAGYIEDVASNEYKAVLLEIYEADIARDANTGFNLKPKLDLVKQRLDTSKREALMIELLNEKYRSFLNDELSGDSLLGMCYVVLDNAYYEAYDYAGVIIKNAESVVIYRSLYATLQGKMAGNDYFGVLDVCKNVVVDDWDVRYKKLFEEMYSSAYENGKTYYYDRLEELIASGDKAKAIELMNRIEAYYGDEVDISSARSRLIDGWQQAYLDFMENYDVTSASQTVNTVLLYDINDDDVPEMFLFDSADVDMAYIGCEVYNVVNNKCKHLGFYYVVNICDDGYLITIPSSGAGDEAYALTSYDGEKLTEGEDCKKIGENYYINGQEVSDADYLSVRTGILAHASAYTLKNSKSVDIADAMEYIMFFENK